MANTVKGGNSIYGFDVGVLMLDSRFPRIVGDIGNAKTWQFPVLYKVVKGYKPKNVVLELTYEDINPFIDAAKELQAEGVKIITTSCGFLSLFQEELAKELDVPVVCSTIVMLPMLCRIAKRVLVLSANSEHLTYKHIESSCGDVSDLSYKIIGTQNEKVFTNFTVQNWEEVDTDLCEKEILDVLHNEIDNCKEKYGCILFECTNLAPYSDKVRAEFNIPVFDIVSLINMMHASVDINSFDYRMC